MLKKLLSSCAIIILSATSALAAPSPTAAKFEVAQPTGIPGATLQPGSYNLRIVDHLSDRYILKVDGPGSDGRTSFLGIPNAAMKGSSGKITWSKGAQDEQYVKGWNFGGPVGALEFVYPKDEAVALAKANQTRVAAIDPASEGRASSSGLSKDDMQMVTLWLLSPTHVGPGDASGGIKAERYAQVAKLTQKPVIARLPHTASNLGLVELAGLLAVAGAAGIRFRRRAIS